MQTVASLLSVRFTTCSGRNYFGDSRILYRSHKLRPILVVCQCFKQFFRMTNVQSPLLSKT